MTERTPQDRAEFEAWMRDGYYANLATTGDFDEQRDRYREIADHMAWCAWRAARAAQPVGVPEGWADAYRAFLAAFDNPIARRRQDDDFSSDARRRMRDINEAMLAARPAAPAAEPECNYAEGGRESVDEALEIVESFGPGIQGVNDSFARQIILAAEVRRLREGRVEVIDMRLTEWAARRVAVRLEANNKNCYTRVCPPGGKDE